MIFKIVDGRECFYQWDTNRQIAVDDPTITEVHFCNRVDNCSLVVEVVDGVANVPNVILQYGFKLKVFGYDGEATMHEQEFEVKARTKPSDYVYTETEIKRFDDLNKRIDKIEEEGISQEAIDTAVDKYLEENPIQDITKVSQLENDADYATGGYVDSKIAGIVMPDLEPYAKKTDIPDTAGLASKSFVVSYVGEVTKKIDLTDYAKKTDIPTDYLTEIPAQYVTESELQAKGYSTFSGRYADLTGKPEIPSTDGLAPVTYVDNKFNSIDLTDYAKKAEVAMTYAKKSDIPTDYLKEVPAEYVTDNELAAKNYANKTYVDEAVKNVSVDLTGYATEEYVDEAVKNVSVDLTPYATKTEVAMTYAKKSEIPKNYLTEVPAEYVTESELSAKGYASKTYVDEAVAGLDTPDLSGFVTEEDLLDTKLSTVYDYLMLTGLTVFNPNSTEDIDEFKNYLATSPYATWYGEDTISDIDCSVTVISESCIRVEYSAPLRLFNGHIYMKVGAECFAFTSVTAYKNYFGSKLAYHNNKSDLTSTTIVKAIEEVNAKVKAIQIPDVDLTNYYTKDETTQAIQEALNAIGVAEGGAY